MTNAFARPQPWADAPRPAGRVVYRLICTYKLNAQVRGRRRPWAVAVHAAAAGLVGAGSSGALNDLPRATALAPQEAGKYKVTLPAINQ